MKPSPSSSNPQVKSQRAKRRTPIWLRRALRGLLAIIIILPLFGALYQAIATEMDKRNHLAPGEMIDIGGHRLHLYCVGENVEGSPTVILEHGLGATSAAWAHVQPEIAQTTRVCAYDRAGMGWSDPGPSRVTLNTLSPNCTACFKMRASLAHMFW